MCILDNIKQGLGVAKVSEVTVARMELENKRKIKEKI